MPRRPNPTRRTTIWALGSETDLQACVQSKYLNQDGFQARQTTVAGHPALTVTGSIVNGSIEWAEVFEAYTGQTPGLVNQTAAGLILLIRPKRTLALAYGMGWLLLDQSKVEQAFGLKYAIRSLDPEQVRQVTRHILERRARIDRNSVPGGQRIEDFVVEEYGEIVSRLVGKGRAPGLTFSTTGRTHFSLAGADSLAMPVARTATDLMVDLDEIERIADETEPADELRFVEQLRTLKAKDPRQARLAKQLAGDVAAGTARVALAYPFERDDEHGEAEAYRLRVPGSDTVVVDDLDVALLTDAVGSVPGEQWLEDLARMTIQALADDQGTQVIGRAITANKWITAEVTLDGQHYFYRQGNWYEVGSGYLEFLKGQVADILAEPTPVAMPAWSTAEEEKDYNKRVGADLGYVVLDRKLVYTTQHPRGIELCDLLGPDNELIHVKKADSSAPLSHLFAQGIVSCEALITDAEARAELRRRVAEERPNQLLSEDWRPRQVVYAMALGREITSDTLFTFTQVVLVRSVQQLSRMQVGATVAQVDFTGVLPAGVGAGEEVRN